MTMTISDAKAIDINDLLSDLGHQPARRDGNRRTWYISPIRAAENTASFAVFADGARWADYGEGEGGDIIDLVRRLYPDLTTTPEALQALSEMTGRIDTARQRRIEAGDAWVVQRGAERGEVDEPFAVTRVADVTYDALIDYARRRGIGRRTLQLTRQVHFRDLTSGKAFFGLGVKNLSGGYDVRNSAWKGVVGPKDVAWLRAGDERVVDVVEGLFDALALIESGLAKGQVMVLCGVGMRRRGAELLARLPADVEIRLHLDQDRGGRGATADILEAVPRATDVSARYVDHADVAGWWEGTGATSSATNREMVPA
ncbi:hypothetical protein CRT60_01120 [Azospirillum palustre]|uniref:DNA primase n=1 Tax=Azospirillum palustre TaxID=2044885 RepID=A0A2B8BNZ7_9PROT|nr:toprim domain-containing protein [Azospirillum palustre]PGH59263.1 hypothetical protein CRT60_01120 [Azospirillum palustre]